MHAASMPPAAHRGGQRAELSPRRCACGPRSACSRSAGPAGQIALMHRVLVEEKKWIDEPRYLSALNFCMLLPGPEAMQLATYVGWRLHGLKGGLAAGLLFVLPGALVVLALSMLYAALGKLPVAEALLIGREGRSAGHRRRGAAAHRAARLEGERRPGAGGGSLRRHLLLRRCRFP